MSDTNHRLTLISPARIALIYALFAVLWILLSDRALHVMGLEPERSSRIQTAKGVVFVLGSAVLLFVLTRAATGQARRAERLAQEHDERYRGLVETSPDGVFISSDRKIVFVNPAFARMLGASTPDDLLGRDVLSFIHPDYHEIVRDRIRRLYENHEAVPLIQERFQHADGSWVPVEIAASPFTYEGRPAAQVVVRDVSERARAERALRESEQRFRNMAANIPGAIFRYILNPDGTDRVEYMSPGCVAIWEADASEIGQSASLLWEVIDAEYVEGVKESVDASARTGQPWSHAWKITTRSGKHKWLQGFGQPEIQPDGRVVWDSVIFDITENKQARDAMLEAEHRLAFVLDNITDGFFMLDAGLRFVNANPAFTRMTSQPSGAILGRAVFEVFPEATGSIWEQALQRVGKTGEAALVEDYYEPLGKWFEARVSRAPEGLAVFLSDITDRKRAEQRQQLMMRELDHRVKNNLAAVLAITESSLRDADSLDQFSKSFVGRIRAMAAMHSLLAEQRWEGVGLLSMLHKVVAPYATDHSPNRISMTGPDLLLPSNAAPAICMTVHELATNAAKHGALSWEHGRVEIAWEFDPNSRDFRFRWAERAGPPVPENIEPGFGMDLLQGVVPYELDGETTVRFTREGLEATIFVPGASMRAAAVISHPTPEASS